MRFRSFVLACAACSLVACAEASSTTGSDLGAPGGTIEFEVNVARVRSVGWVDSSASDADALKAAQGIVRRRLDALDLGLEVALDPAQRTLTVSPTDVMTLGTRANVAFYIESLGATELLLEARTSDMRGLATLDGERSKLDEWLAEHPGASLVEFNALAPEVGGPHPLLLWVKISTPPVASTEAAPTLPIPEPIRPMLLPDRPERAFGRRHLAMMFAWNSQLYIHPTRERERDLSRFAQHNAARLVGVMLEDELVIPPHEFSDSGDAVTIEDVDSAIAETLSTAFLTTTGPLERR